MKLEFISKSADQTKYIASLVSNHLFKGAVITLNGDLGAGKTTFTQGLGLSMGISSKINSPTFNILKCYFEGRLPLYHIDAYRLEDNVNSDIGLEEVIQGDGVCVIEWSNFIEDLVFEPLNVNIEIVNENMRKFTFESEECKYEKIFESLRELIWVILCCWIVQMFIWVLV